uniref:hypothetical protein n=1 Tax=Symphyocladia marchantioides TaxID=88360 RepID=UPI0022FD61F6|nr:hypothetical protein PNW48_pgp192 [Symphyocladia marchantioides]WAX03779.1 hypothetical protein [Symphyocladia marchantioides]
MCNNILFFRLYLLIVVSFLSIFSFFISKHLFRLVFNNLKFLFIFNQLKKEMSCNTDNYVSLFSFYVLRGNLSLSVALSEFILEMNDNFIDKYLVYDSLAYSYYSNSFYAVSEYYCFKVLSCSPHNYKMILNLANIYSDLGYKTKANDMFIRVGKLESDYLLS